MDECKPLSAGMIEEAGARLGSGSGGAAPPPSAAAIRALHARDMPTAGAYTPSDFSST